MDKKTQDKILKSIRNQRYRYSQKDKQLRMSKLTDMHKSLTDSMTFNVDNFVGDCDISTLVDSLKEEKSVELSALTGGEVEKFVEGVKGDNALDMQGGKRLDTYANTAKELKAAEEAVVKAVKARDQLKANKRALLAIVSDKALKVIQRAHADLLIEKAVVKRKEMDGSQPGGGN